MVCVRDEKREEGHPLRHLTYERGVTRLEKSGDRHRDVSETMVSFGRSERKRKSLRVRKLDVTKTLVGIHCILSRILSGDFLDLRPRVRSEEWGRGVLSSVLDINI